MLFHDLKKQNIFSLTFEYIFMPFDYPKINIAEDEFKLHGKKGFAIRLTALASQNFLVIPLFRAALAAWSILKAL